MKRISIVLFLGMFLFSMLSGNFDNEYDINDVRIYQNTPVWELAKAVNNQDAKKIAYIYNQHFCR